MKLFVIGSGVPYRRDGKPGVTAVHIVTFELLRALRQLGHEPVFQLLFNRFRTDPALLAAEQQALAELETMGVRVLPPLCPPDGTEGGDSQRLQRVLRRLSGWADVEAYYPALALRHEVAARVQAHGIQAILTIWSPDGIAASHGVPCRKVAYHGDPDFYPMEMRLRDPSLFPMSPMQAWRTRWWLQGFRRAHLELMRGVEAIGNIMAANAGFYESQGHPRSFYARSLWSDQEVCAPPAAGRTIKIIGHAGNLGATGGTYGLQCLLETLPYLETEMQGRRYEVHVFGGGQLSPALKALANHPRVVFRGFVEDYDAELCSSDIFLMLNNAGPYQGAHTRQIIAWSLGLCLVAHANSRGAIPETQHLENALTGSTPEEIARHIRLAATDTALNHRLRAGGRRTYEQYFRPRMVAEALSTELTRAIPAAQAQDAACLASS